VELEHRVRHEDRERLEPVAGRRGAPQFPDLREERGFERREQALDQRATGRVHGGSKPPWQGAKYKAKNAKQRRCAGHFTLSASQFALSLFVFRAARDKMDEARIGGENAVVITVCVGSSCHVRGSHEILQRYSDIIAEHRLKDQVSLRGSFCMERCAEGVNMDIDGEPLSAHNLKDAERIFQDKVLSKLRPEPRAVSADGREPAAQS
jgi:hypothetical protein